MAMAHLVQVGGIQVEKLLVVGVLLFNRARLQRGNVLKSMALLFPASRRHICLVVRGNALHIRYRLHPRCAKIRVFLIGAVRALACAGVATIGVAASRPVRPCLMTLSTMALQLFILCKLQGSIWDKAAAVQALVTSGNNVPLKELWKKSSDFLLLLPLAATSKLLLSRQPEATAQVGILDSIVRLLNWDEVGKTTLLRLFWRAPR